MRPLTRAAAARGSAVPCPKVPCLPSDVCCGGNKCCNSNTHTCCEGLCLEDGGPVGCCGGRAYPRSKATCCGGKRCDKATHFCCEGECLERSGRIGCCHDRLYDRFTQICCPQAGRGGHKCNKGEECCGKSACCRRGEACCGNSACCKKGEQCCNSGRLRYCAPKGRCCPKGQHRVTCGTGKHLCCPEDEYCCGGKCCKTGDCHNGVCKRGCGPFGTCPNGQACCGEGGPNEHCYDYATTQCCAPYCGDPGAPAPCGSPTLANPFAGCCPPGQCCTDCFNSTGVARRPMCCPESVQGKPVFGCCGNTCCNTSNSGCGAGDTCK
jgi:hypothetical protein